MGVHKSEANFYLLSGVTRLNVALFFCKPKQHVIYMIIVSYYLLHNSPSKSSGNYRLSFSSLGFIHERHTF